MISAEMSTVPSGGNKYFYIYMITCRNNGRKYIGRTRIPSNRKYLHLLGLRNGNHPNEEMQKDFILYGEEAFNFVVIDRVEQGLRVGCEAERKWMREYRSYDIESGYNYKDPKFHPRRNHTKKKAAICGMKEGN